MAKTRKRKETKHGPLVAVALSSFDTLADFADAMRVSPALAWQWANDYRPVAAHHAARLEEVSQGRVTRIDLYPEIFG